MEADHQDDEVTLPFWLTELCQRLEDNNQVLLVVNLNLRRINSASMEYLCQRLRVYKHLLSLNLTNSLEAPSRHSLRPLLDVVLGSPSSSSGIKELSLDYNNLTGPLQEEGMPSFLSTNRCLTRLYLRNNRIDCETAKELAGGLACNQALQILQLASNAIQDRGAEFLATALHSNQTLRHLSLSFNSIGDSGAEQLATALRSNRTLRSLALRGNRIGDGGAQHLAKALVSNRTLQFLDMSDNKITSVGAAGFWETLWVHTNTTLCNLILERPLKGTCPLIGRISTVCAANRRGRKLLLNCGGEDGEDGRNSPSLSLVPLILAKAQPSVIFVFLLEMHGKMVPTHHNASLSSSSSKRDAKRIRHE